jgi:hypothetical protein
VTPAFCCLPIQYDERSMAGVIFIVLTRTGLMLDPGSGRPGPGRLTVAGFASGSVQRSHAKRRTRMCVRTCESIATHAALLEIADAPVLFLALPPLAHRSKEHETRLGTVRRTTHAFAEEPAGLSGQMPSWRWRGSVGLHPRFRSCMHGAPTGTQAED